MSKRDTPYIADDVQETEPKLLRAQVFAQPRGIIKEPNSCLKVEVKDRSEGVGACTWDDPVLAPNEYYRSRTVFEICDGDNLDCYQNLKENIMRCLKTRSVHAVYVGATANCKTSSWTKFTIRLLRQSKNSNILVDVRRRSGCSIAFRDEYQAVRKAAEFGEINSQIPRSVASPFVDMEFMQGDHIPIKEDTIEWSLLTSITHLDSHMHDTCVLTLQDLLSMTNPMSKETSSAACKLILEKHPKIFNYVVKDITKKVDYDDMEDDTDEYLRSLTLNLLGNVLSSASNMQMKKYYTSIADVLAWYVDMAFNCPWNACLAVKCLRLLWPVSEKVGSEKVVQCVRKAEEVGKHSHVLLEKEAGQALEVMKISTHTE